jgi:hypothetical protein
MIDRVLADLRSSLSGVLANPTPDGLWQLHKALLVIDRPEAARARSVARAFQSCLRTLESKSASRAASRLGAVLGTASVASVNLPEMRYLQERGLGELLERALPAVLEIGAAMQSAQAWDRGGPGLRRVRVVPLRGAVGHLAQRPDRADSDRATRAHRPGPRPAPGFRSPRQRPGNAGRRRLPVSPCCTRAAATGLAEP